MIAQGKIDVPNASIEWELENGENGPTFSAGGTIAENGRGVSFGQNLDEIYEMTEKPTAELIKIYTIWKTWHLNDLTAGTPEQEKAIKEWSKNNRYDYTHACNHLKSLNLSEVELPEAAKCTGSFPNAIVEGKRGYRYGERWIYTPIPSNIIRILKDMGEKS